MLLASAIAIPRLARASSAIGDSAHSPSGPESTRAATSTDHSMNIVACGPGTRPKDVRRRHPCPRRRLVLADLFEPRADAGARCAALQLTAERLLHRPAPQGGADGRSSRTPSGTPPRDLNGHDGVMQSMTGLCNHRAEA